MTRPVSTRWLLACALGLALPAYWLANESFRPIEERFTLDGGQPTYVFTLAEPEPLYLEYILTLRAPGDARPAAVVELNGARAATIQGDRRHVVGYV